MTKKEAIAKIEHALLTENAQIIVPKGKTYEEHVLKLSEMLLGQVIEPVRVKVTSSIIEEADFDNYKNSEVWAIARTKDNWLLTISGLKEFSLGFGASPEAIVMHGCSSSDVLGEWCA